MVLVGTSAASVSTAVEDLRLAAEENLAVAELLDSVPAGAARLGDHQGLRGGLQGDVPGAERRHGVRLVRTTALPGGRVRTLCGCGSWGRRRHGAGLVGHLKDGRADLDAARAADRDLTRALDQRD